MRFFADGPDIPDLLLSARSSGDVVFLCGAGVSQPAGLPSFARLTEAVIRSLDVPIGASSRTILTQFAAIPSGPPFDQVFDELHREYGAARIGQELVKALSISSVPDLRRHQTMLRLSRDLAGSTQLVTTNFDNLFELADAGLDSIVPPRLPDLASGDRLAGVVYLHGKLHYDRKAQDLILRASDFGRAYLTDGWATRFLRELIDSYVVVLVGYSANDPPVKYLLQGLNSHPHRKSARIYAFDRGDASEVEARWSDRGVTAIPYQRHEPKHSELWQTLDAWASQANEPEAWSASMIALARRGPRDLAPHERGQVAAFVASAEGARAFANAKPPIPADWLCVFDRNLRFGRPTRTSLTGADAFDPLATYRLDDDPGRPPEGGRRTVPVGRDLLTASPLDHRLHSRTRIAGIAREQADPLPPRLFAMAQWIASSLHDPIVSWWASHQSSLHPRLLWLLEYELARVWTELPAPAQRNWTFLLERFLGSPPDERDGEWYELSRRIAREGWTRSTLRALANAIKPSIRVADRILGDIPPLDWTARHAAVDFDVHFPGHNHGELTIPPEQVSAVVNLLGDALKVGTGLLEDTGKIYWKTNSFHPEPDSGAHHYSEADAFLLWYRTLFERLARDRPDLARSELARWPLDDRFFFGKLTLYAAGLSFLPIETAAELFLAVADTPFWDSYLRRELLFSLRARWPEFSEEHRLRLEARLLAGAPIWDRDPSEERQRFKIGDVVSTLGWLAREGCALSDQTQTELHALRESLPDWRPEWDANAAQSFDSRGGFVVPVEDTACLDGLSLAEIVPAAVEHSGRGGFRELRSYEPFTGLVKSRPLRALAALAYEGRRGSYPVPFWQALLSNWPEASVRARWLVAERVSRLPSSVYGSISHYSTRWFQTHLPALAETNEGSALAIWDRALAGLLAADPTARAGAILHDDDTVPPTFDDAINAPAGHMVDALTSIIGALGIESGQGIPARFQERLERLLTIDGAVCGHVAARLGQQARWLWSIDAAWVERVYVPIFDPSHPYAASAWDGLLFGSHVPQPGLFAVLKPAFRAMLVQETVLDFRARRERRLHEWMMIATYWGTKDKAYLTATEATEILRATDNAGRAAAASTLIRIVESSPESWQEFVRPFLLSDWPKELRLRSREVASALMRLAEVTSACFPDAVNTIVPFLLPLEGPDLFLYRYSRNNDENGGTLTRRFPAAVLALLDAVIGDTPETSPYELRQILDELADTMPGARQDLRWRRLFQLTA